jgi:outer membrane scaffolding protein for murein synthesis (MipA/OmpV family)
MPTYASSKLLQNIIGVSNMRFFLMSWFILSLLSKPLWASEEGQLTIGAASITSSNIYAGASNETRALPDLKYSKGALCLERTKMARGFFNFSLLMS